MKKTLLLTFILFFFAAGFWSFKNAVRSAKTNIVNKVCVSTEYGDIKIMLYEETPLHRDNFIKLVSQKYYDGCLFHRVIKQFMIQGGDPDSKMADSTAILGNGGPDYTIPAEFVSKYYHKKGALGAARTNNPQKASSGSQFYIVQGKVFTQAELDALSTNTHKTFSKEQRDIYTTIGGTPHLDGDYTVFGEVFEGLDVVDKIASVQTGMYDRPKKDIKMTIKIIE